MLNKIDKTMIKYLFLSNQQVRNYSGKWFKVTGIFFTKDQFTYHINSPANNWFSNYLFIRWSSNFLFS